MCFYNEDASYLSNGHFKHLALCLVENTKPLEDFTCFNNGTQAVACKQQILDHMNFRLAPGNTNKQVPAVSEHTSVLDVLWGDMNVIVKPIHWGNCSLVNVSGILVNPCEELI